MSARTRLLLGATGVAVTAAVVRRDGLGPRETAAYLAVNGLPDAWYRPVWVVMQGGSLGAAPAAALVARRCGQPQLAVHLLAGGTASWALSKVLKRVVQRPRPQALVPGSSGRGREASGLGYVSGHAAVAVALAAGALPHLGPRGRLAALTAAPVVGLARLYVGAHLPLDVLGGAALGLAVDAAVALAEEGARTRRGPVLPQEDRAAGAGAVSRRCPRAPCAPEPSPPRRHGA